MTIHVVDRHLVAPADVAELVALVQREVLPVMEGAGATFVLCEVAPDLGDDAEVLTVWSCGDFGAWNVIRRNLMLEPRYHEYATTLTRLRRGGTRRFYATDDVAPAALDDDEGPAIRRWEMFSLAADASSSARDRLRRAMAECEHFIPGITRCAVGSNTAGGPIELVWETTYESVGAYRTTYMTHPYHAALLDRFLLPDCPERITTGNEFGAGLIGYPVQRDRRLGPVAIRRLLLLDFGDDAAAAARVADAVSATDDGWSDSILAGNTMSTRWFDGVTDLGGRPAWSHVWDQCFATVEQYEAHVQSESAAAAIESELTVPAAEVVYVPEVSAGTADPSSPRAERDRS